MGENSMAEDKIKGLSVYEMIRAYRDEHDLDDEELGFIWSMGVNTWEDSKEVTWGALLKFVNNEGNFKKWMDKFENAYDTCAHPKEETKRGFIIERDAWRRLGKIIEEWREFKMKIKDLLKDKGE
jgi:hypothetical protein